MKGAEDLCLQGLKVSNEKWAKIGLESRFLDLFKYSDRLKKGFETIIKRFNGLKRVFRGK